MLTPETYVFLKEHVTLASFWESRFYVADSLSQMKSFIIRDNIRKAKASKMLSLKNQETIDFSRLAVGNQQKRITLLEAENKLLKIGSAVGLIGIAYTVLDLTGVLRFSSK